MKNWYFATYVVGFKSLVEKQLREDLPNIKIDTSFDGLVLFNTSAPFSEISDLPYLNSAFSSIKAFEVNDFAPNDMLKNISSDESTLDYVTKTKFKQGGTFRVVISDENETLSNTHSPNLVLLEHVIKEHTGLRLDIYRAEIEFWVLYRSEGRVFWGVRKRPKRVHLEAGQLRPELAHLLALMSEPSKQDVFYDPFAGYGAIPMARSAYPFKQRIIQDNNPQMIHKIKDELGQKKTITYIVNDALSSSPLVPDHTVDKIITDPPWGQYQTEINPRHLYKQLVREFKRVLASDGIIVMLIKRDPIVEQILSEGFAVHERYEVLVSGQKAVALKLRNIPLP